ncbi:PREDICTED: uncharacterized protein LOC104732594 [Camelina sativa]|uniref:Uncharacterized protein LOC104732594 n=1 Tax=Camelina sativa TaxID=90675 RepID=A0ABM1QSS4_CAMSA|nr:PREDICTED: uncharacterized protein LOC104732594 [Camelina sativa]XP_019089814.1 PREDICTED: uncharacterized protein LOC104732594 [Camelina sativa]XP_019089815.1 PREDICTED: uncharacterized protein LOC104732594 [Camelina sativa]XP_019089816.1 PREDICTED: uncharacterized protein LOC104732594 [Camelina sativa]
MLLDIGLEEVLTLLECIFTSNAPSTDTFLNKQSQQGMKKIYKSFSPCLEKKEEEAEPGKVITLKAIVRKQDMMILYVECAEEFVELLFSFLVFPLESVLEFSGSSISLGCIGNLCRSFKELTAKEGTGLSNSICTLPPFYSFQMQLPGIITQQPPVCYPKYRFDQLALMDPKSSGSSKSTQCYRFLKKGRKFTVLDDLTITSNSCSTVSLLKKFQSHADDLEVKEISISNAEALNLLRASLVTSSALNTAFWSLFAEKVKEETDLGDPVSKKVKEEET